MRCNADNHSQAATSRVEFTHCFYHVNNSRRSTWARAVRRANRVNRDCPTRGTPRFSAQSAVTTLSARESGHFRRSSAPDFRAPTIPHRVFRRSCSFSRLLCYFPCPAALLRGRRRPARQLLLASWTLSGPVRPSLALRSSRSWLCFPSFSEFFCVSSPPTRRITGAAGRRLPDLFFLFAARTCRAPTALSRVIPFLLASVELFKSPSVPCLRRQGPLRR